MLKRLALGNISDSAQSRCRDNAHEIALRFSSHLLFPSSYLAVSFPNLLSSIKRQIERVFSQKSKVQNSFTAGETVCSVRQAKAASKGPPNRISPAKRTAVCTAQAAQRCSRSQRTIVVTVAY